MLQEITASILERFPEDRRQEAQSLMEKYKNEPTIAHLIKELSAENPNYLDLFARGIAHLPTPTERGNPLVTAYFFLLSEIEKLPGEARSFALQASVYAELRSEHEAWHRAFALESRYIFKETVWPLLV